MKKSIIKKSLLTTLSLILSINVFATNTLDDIKKMPVDYVPIIVTRKPANANMHRGLIQDVEAYYQNGSIYLNFNNNIGEVIISVTNIQTGQLCHNCIDSTQNTCSIDISSLGVGQYEILIYNDLLLYEGSFVL